MVVALRRARVASPRAMVALLVVLVGVSARLDASPAIIDLRDWNFDEAPIAPVSGVWDMHWERLVDSEDVFPEPSGQFEMPGVWNEWPSEAEAVGGTGYATFRTTVLLPPGLQTGALRVPNASTSYRLWGNGELLSRSGEPGTDRQSTRPHYRVTTARFRAPEGRLHLVLQVANFHHRRGGMWRPIEVGSVARIESKHALETAYDLLLIGSFIGLIVYNLLVWRSAGKRARAPFYLAVLFGVLALRIAMMGQMMVTRLFPEFPWGVQLRIEYLTAHFALLALTLILHAIYPRVISRWIVAGTAVLTGINTLSVLVMPVLVYSRHVQIYVYAMIAVLAIELTLLVLSLLRGRRETLAGVFAVAITFLITLGETIHYQGWILSRDFAPFGFAISLLTGGSLDQSAIYLVSAGINLVLVFVVANFLAVRGSRSLLVIEEREGDDQLRPAELAARATTGNAPRHEPSTTEQRRERLQAEYDITRREGEIVALVAEGLSNKEIAGRLYISEATVKSHMYRILRKVGVGNRTELSRWYYSQLDG